jgi:hypothetical protein
MEEEKVLVEDNFYLDLNDEREVFVFKSFGNRTRPEEKQMKAYLKPFSGKDLSLISVKVIKDINDYKKDNPNTDLSFSNLYSYFSQKWEFAYRIEKLENIKFKVDGKIIEITDPLELYSYENTRATMLCSELQIHFTKVDNLNVKN